MPPTSNAHKDPIFLDARKSVICSYSSEVSGRKIRLDSGILMVLQTIQRGVEAHSDTYRIQGDALAYATLSGFCGVRVNRKKLLMIIEYVRKFFYQPPKKLRVQESSRLNYKSLIENLHLTLYTANIYNFVTSLLSPKNYTMNYTESLSHIYNGYIQSEQVTFGLHCFVLR